jgi:hypothetical protein
MQRASTVCRCPFAFDGDLLDLSCFLRTGKERFLRRALPHVCVPMGRFHFKADYRVTQSKSKGLVNAHSDTHTW